MKVRVLASELLFLRIKRIEVVLGRHLHLVRLRIWPHRATILQKSAEPRLYMANHDKGWIILEFSWMIAQENNLFFGKSPDAKGTVEGICNKCFQLFRSKLTGGLYEPRGFPYFQSFLRLARNPKPHATIEKRHRDTTIQTIQHCVENIHTFMVSMRPATGRFRLVICSLPFGRIGIYDLILRETMGDELEYGAFKRRIIDVNRMREVEFRLCLQIFSVPW